MRNMKCLVTFLVLICFGLGTSAYADSFTFTTFGSADITGAAGSTIGWGYVITNTSTQNWLWIVDLTADPFVHATPDASIFDFPILAPGATRSVPYAPLSFSGLYQLTWDPNAPNGFVNTGLFTLTGKWFDADPFGGGIETGQTEIESTAYSATVRTGTTVPEPSSVVLLVIGCIPLLFAKRRRMLFVEPDFGQLSRIAICGDLNRFTKSIEMWFYDLRFEELDGVTWPKNSPRRHSLSCTAIGTASTSAGCHRGYSRLL